MAGDDDEMFMTSQRYAKDNRTECVDDHNPDMSH